MHAGAVAAIVSEVGADFVAALVKRFGDLRDNVKWLPPAILREHMHKYTDNCGEEQYITVPAASAVNAARRLLQKWDEFSSSEQAGMFPEEFTQFLLLGTPGRTQLASFAEGRANIFTGFSEPLRAFPQLDRLVEIFAAFASASVPVESAFSRIKAANVSNTNGKTPNLDIHYRAADGSREIIHSTRSSGLVPQLQSSKAAACRRKTDQASAMGDLSIVPPLETGSQRCIP